MKRKNTERIRSLLHFTKSTIFNENMFFHADYKNSIGLLTI